MLDDYLESLETAQGEQAVQRICLDFFSRHGFSRAIYLHADATGTAMFTSLPETWLHHYRDNDYIQIDPFFDYCCTSLQPVGTGVDYLRDHDYLSAAAQRLIREASEAGVRSGFSCTTRRRGPAGVGGWNIGSELPREETEKIRSEKGAFLQLAALYGHERLIALRSETGRKPALTPREQDCLCYSANGYRTKEIAERMGLAPVSVDLYLKNARRKLGAATREQAVAIAILNKLIRI